MVRNKEKGIGSEKGFTMIELIIVIAIMGILSAIVVPSFTNMTRKSRLKADISTIQQVQTQIDIYTADHDGDYPGLVANTPPAAGDTSKMLHQLVTDGYIKASDVTGADATDRKVKLQSSNVVVKYDTVNEHLILEVTKDTKEAGTLDSLGATDWAKKSS